MVFARDPCTSSRFDLADKGSADELTFLTGSDAGSVKKLGIHPPIHPKQRTSANKNAPLIIVAACPMLPPRPPPSPPARIAGTHCSYTSSQGIGLKPDV